MTGERKIELFDEVLGWIWMHTEAEGKEEYVRALKQLGFTEEEIVEELSNCDFDEEDDSDYTPSSENGDYSPSDPWNAPGMKMSDFI
jgi:hypothetical protein